MPPQLRQSCHGFAYAVPDFPLPSHPSLARSARWGSGSSWAGPSSLDVSNRIVHFAVRPRLAAERGFAIWLAWLIARPLALACPAVLHNRPGGRHASKRSLKHRGDDFGAVLPRPSDG